MQHSPYSPHLFIPDLVARVTGPLHKRLILQPTMATIVGIRDGIKDAKNHKPAYFWACCTDKGHREEFLRNGFKSVAKILILAVILDAIYQFIALRAFHPLQAIVVALVLAFVPYLIIRGPVNRIVRWWYERRPPTSQVRPESEPRIEPREQRKAS